MKHCWQIKFVTHEVKIVVFTALNYAHDEFGISLLKVSLFVSPISISKKKKNLIKGEKLVRPTKDSYNLIKKKCIFDLPMSFSIRNKIHHMASFFISFFIIHGYFRLMSQLIRSHTSSHNFHAYRAAQCVNPTILYLP